MSWRYENAGTADTLIVAGTTLTDLPESQSKTGTAFYQTYLAKCFDLPATDEIWIKFDVYFNGSNRWRAYNTGFTGITAQTTKAIFFFSNDNEITSIANAAKTNQLQTVLLHMVSGSSAGVIEAWVDGNFIYRYTGDVNHGEDFEDIYLQSDGAGTFFSNVVISDEVPFFYIDADTECTITNATWTPQKNLAVWLPFDESTTKDLCGNTWTTSTASTVDFDNAINYKAFQNKQAHSQQVHLLTMSESLALGGQSFTIRGWFNLTSYTGLNPGSYLFGLSNTNGEIFLLRGDSGTWIQLSCLGFSTSSVTIARGTTYFYEVVYDHSAGTISLFLDGKIRATLNLRIPRTEFKLGLGYSFWTSDTPIGSFDEFQVYDGAALHSADFTPPTNLDYIQEELDFTGEAYFAFCADTECEVINNGDAVLTKTTFTGASGCYGEIPKGVLAGATTFTIEAKFSTTSTKNNSSNYTWATIIGRELSGTWQNDFGLCVNNGKLCFWSEPKTGGSSSTHNTTSQAVVNDGAIHDVAVVSSEGAIDLYCDGVLVAHTSGVNAKITDAYPFRIAYNGNTNSYLQMDLYELRLWSIARTQKEIFATLDGSEEGLEAWYVPDINQPEIIPDLTANARHVTLYNATAEALFEYEFSYDANVVCTVLNAAYTVDYDLETAPTSELILVEDDTFHLTGTAFYSVDLTLPSMQEVWIEFSVYNRDLDGWQVGNDKNNFTGIAGEPPDSQDTSTPLDFAAYNLNSVISNDTGGLTKEVQTVLLHMLADELIGVVEVWIDGVPHLNYQGNVNGGNPFDSLFLHSSGATCFNSFRLSNTEFPSTQHLQLDFDTTVLVTNEVFAWSVDETHVERIWAPPGGTYPPNFIDVVVHDRTAWYQTVVTKAFDLPPTYHLWIDFDVYFDGVHHWRAGNIGSAGLCGVTSGNPLSGFSNGVQVYPTTNLLQAAGDYEWTPVLVHLQSGTTDGVLEAWFNGDKVFAYTGNVNDGEPFADPVLQSDGAGTYFSTLLFSTNQLDPRRNVDAISLCLLRSGEVLTFPLYAYETCNALALAIRYDGRNWYNVLRDPSDERASDFYITHAESTYALTKG